MLTDPDIEVVEVKIGFVVKVGFAVAEFPPTQIQIPGDSHFPVSVAVTLYAPGNKQAGPAALADVLAPVSTHFHKKLSVVGAKALGKVPTVINPLAFQTEPAVGIEAVVLVP